MRVFISWSGEQSKQIAMALRDWLPKVIQAAKPYVSERDNEAGTLWDQIIASELEATNFGIVCLTPSNLGSQWIHFEAGALSKAAPAARVAPLLFQLRNADVGLPLSRFMMKPLDREGVLDVLKSMNTGLELDQRLSEADLVDVFDGMWEKLRAKLDAVPTAADPSPEENERPDRELLEEILLLLRSTTRRPSLLAERALAQSERTTSNRNFTSMLVKLREIAGPSGLVEMSGNERVTVRSPRLTELSTEEIIELRTIEAYYNDHGVAFDMEVIQEPSD